MELSYPLGTTRRVLQEKFSQSQIINPSLIKLGQSRWLDIGCAFFFCEFMDLNSVSVHKHAKKELGQYPAILTSHLVNNPYLLMNNTWDLVPPPEGKNIVGSCWVLKVKHDENGSVNRFKARLVAQGYSQAKGVDYDEVFSPVARNTSVRSLLALANVHDLEIHQMDVKTAFLNGSLDCEIYMLQPEGFVDTDRPNHVCKLKKSIYELKQSACCWNTTLDEYLKSVGYHKSNADGCIYVKSVKDVNDRISFVILGVYVDNIITVLTSLE